MRGSKVLLTAAAMAAFSFGGFAQTATPAPPTPAPDPAFQQGQAPPPKNLPDNVNPNSVRGRNKVEADRIADGVKNGSLTPEEANRLKSEEHARIKEEKRMASDGKLTTAERNKLERQETRESKQIRRARHNNQNQ